MSFYCQTADIPSTKRLWMLVWTFCSLWSIFQLWLSLKQSNNNSGEIVQDAIVGKIERFYEFLRNYWIRQKRRSLYIYIGSQLGLPGSSGSRVDQVSPGQIPSWFLLRPGPIPGPGRPGLGRPVGPGWVLKQWPCTSNVGQHIIGPINIWPFILKNYKHL